MILSNQIRCRTCGGTPWSSHRHDYSPCDCGDVAADGGMDYLRRTYKNKDGYVDISIVVDGDHAQGLMDCIEDPTKNTLGKLCSVARYLRDEMNINIGEVKQ